MLYRILLSSLLLYIFDNVQNRVSGLLIFGLVDVIE